MEGNGYQTQSVPHQIPAQKRRSGYRDDVPNDVPERGRNFANLIREARRNKGMTQQQVIDGTGMSKTTIIRWESGNAERPDPDQVRTVCAFLDIDPRRAAVALGYLSPDELGSPDVAGRTLDPAILEVIEALEDPNVSSAEKQQWIDYLRFLRQRSQPGGQNAG